MTVQEAIEWLKAWSATHQNENENVREAVWSGIQALKEVEQYRALGTVEELKEAREKQVAKKPIMKTVVFCDEAEDAYVCSACEGESLLFEGQPYCENCGQALKWGEEDE